MLIAISKSLLEGWPIGTGWVGPLRHTKNPPLAPPEGIYFSQEAIVPD